MFFALWPDPALQARMAATAKAVASNRAIGGRDLATEGLHLTLLFLGDIAPDAEKRLVTAAGRVKARPFDLTLDQAGCFFRSKVFWLGPRTVPRKLTELAQALQAAMAGVGLAPDYKELVPHVTYLRDIRHVIRPAAVDPIIWPVRQFALVHSAGGEYHVVSQWPLQNASATKVKTVQATGGTE